MVGVVTMLEVYVTWDAKIVIITHHTRDEIRFLKDFHFCQLGTS